MYLEFLTTKKDSEWIKNFHILSIFLPLEIYAINKKINFKTRKLNISTISHSVKSFIKLISILFKGK